MSGSASLSIVGLCSSAQCCTIVCLTLKETDTKWQAIYWTNLTNHSLQLKNLARTSVIQFPASEEKTGSSCSLSSWTMLFYVLVY
jgi:hypothetical protein